MNAPLRKILAPVAAVALVAMSASAAQQQTPVATTASGQQNDYVESTGFKSRIFEVKHRDPASLVPVLRPLASGFKGATISASAEYKTLSVRDVPENLAVIEEALKRLDVPQGTRADIELHLHLLVAGKASTGGKTWGEVPQEIARAVDQLRATLNYSNFGLLTPVVQRTREGDWTTGSNGIGGSPQDGSSFKYNYQIRSINRSTDADGAPRVQLNGFEFGFEGSLGRAVVMSNLSLKEGEQVVVGTASLNGGQALVLVLSARVAK